MKFLSVATPKPSIGVSFEGEPIQVVPNQSMSLQEILERFTRDESLPIGHHGEFFDGGDDDLEKIQHADLVDRQEFNEKLNETKKRYEKQEKVKAEKERKRIEQEERERIRKEVEAEHSKAAKQRGESSKNE